MLQGDEIYFVSYLLLGLLSGGVFVLLKLKSQLPIDGHSDMEMFLTDSECDSSSESSCSDYLDDVDSMYGGHAQSILSSLEQSIGKIDDFLAFERSFGHGDFVCSVTDPSGQLGRVVDVDIIVDLENVHGQMIREVNSKKLRKIRSLVDGDYVVHGPWLGRVSRIIDRLTILFGDGAKCEVVATDPENLRPVSPNVVEDSQYPYYPGQHVKIRYSSAFKSARWLCGGWKDNRAEGIVCQVEAGFVHVDWIATAMFGQGLSVPAPPCFQDSKNITLLSCFPHANWNLGDWCILPVDDQMLVKEQESNVATVGRMELERGSRQVSSDSECEKLYVIVKRKAKVDVLWQDGTRSSDLDSQALLPANFVGDHEFWPEQIVQEKGASDDPHVSSVGRLGIVESVDAKERTVKLKWKMHIGNQRDDSGGEYTVETVSAYELIEHPDYSYCLGDIVFRLGKTLSVVESDGQSEHEASEGHWKYPHKDSLALIGNIIGYRDEGILVRWASGLTSKVGPYEIAGIDKYEDLVASPVQDDMGDSSTQDMQTFEKQVYHQSEKDVSENPGNCAGEDHIKNIWEISTYFFPRAAIGFFTNITASLFGSFGFTSLSTSAESTDSFNPQKNRNLDSNNLPSEKENATGSTYKKEVTEYCKVTSEEIPVADDFQTNLKQQVEEDQENKEISYSSNCQRPGQFKKFDIVEDFSDHHFASGVDGGLVQGQVKRGWLKKVHHEWSILEKDLPDTIFIRAYEGRMDLLRAAIFGAPGTPYHDGVFFFDFLLPPDYPHEPPMVHYTSGGLRLNPNLYESGRVCLSLLNTWAGTGTEAWNTGTSTILQVLLSLQALVLNEKPYFNEAGYDQQMGKAEGEKNSMTYNENAFLISCKYMLYVLCHPPKHFEALVEEHFHHRAHSILLACKAYMAGAPVGCAFDCGLVEQEKQKCSSTGFKIMLAKIVPMLISGFTDKGIDCNQFLESG